jgi:hypothetical protein
MTDWQFSPHKIVFQEECVKFSTTKKYDNMLSDNTMLSANMISYNTMLAINMFSDNTMLSDNMLLDNMLLSDNLFFQLWAIIFSDNIANNDVIR